MDLYIKSYFKILNDNIEMYLAYDIATRELIDFSDDYDGERNIDFGYFAY